MAAFFSVSRSPILEFVETDMQELRRLLALDRYERYAHTKRRRASVKLADVSAAEQEGS
jgi:hypothetical protein